MKKDVIALFKAARRVSTPLVAISSSDQRALTARLFEAVGNGDNPAPKLTWDIVRGLMAANDAGRQALAQFGEDRIKASANPVEALVMAGELPPLSILIMYNGHRFLEDVAIVQAIYNLRDAYKGDRRTLVLVGPSFVLPSELQDVVLLDEDLPDDAQLSAILRELFEAAFQKTASAVLQASAVDAARGLSAFAAEQIFAMSLVPNGDGIDLDATWERKRSAVNQVRGLKFTRDKTITFDDLGGIAAARGFADQLFAGGKPPRVVVFVDEVEKMMAGATGPVGDTSGVSQDQLGAWLRWMEDNFYDGLIAVGPPGSGKTAFALAVGASHDVPTVSLDFGALKGSLVGESERSMREALKVIDTIAGGSAFVIATCNKLEALPPEFRRRFRSGIWYFDLPTGEERKAIWKIHLAKYKFVGDEKMPNDMNWTGAEIRNCCDLAWRLGIALEAAAKYIVPVAQAAPESIQALRNAATGRWLSASLPGAYRPATETEGAPRRALNI